MKSSTTQPNPQFSSSQKRTATPTALVSPRFAPGRIRRSPHVAPDVDWQDLFDLQVSVGEKILRALLIYVFLVIALRIVGKRELGQTNTLDLVALLRLVANAVQNGIIGNDNTVTGAVIGASTLFLINEVFSRTAYGSPLVSRVLEGSPSVLIQQGKPLPKSALQGGDCVPTCAIARRQGFADLGEGHTAILETNGVVTMFRKDEPGLYHPAEAAGLRIGKRRRGA